MQAIQFDSQTKQLTLLKKPVPEIADPHEVLVKVAFCGLCGTDLHIMQGEFPCRKDGPITLGHEFSGTVVAVGEEVTAVKVGDKVAADPNNGCNVCKFCHEGNPHYCNIGGINNSIGIWRHGGWAEYALVPDNQIHKLPESITLEQGAFLEPLSCLSHGWDRISPVTLGKKILVLGAGIIGKLWACVLHAHGHREVTVSEPSEQRRNLLRDLDTGFDIISPDTLKQRQSSDPDYLFDVIIDCTGFAPAVEHAFSLLNKGSKLCIFGCAKPTDKISISPFEMYFKEISIIGTIVNPFSFPKAIGLLSAMGERYITYEKLAVKSYALSEYKEAIAASEKGIVSKAVFKF